jgi:hypothetical protein
LGRSKFILNEKLAQAKKLFYFRKVCYSCISQTKGNEMTNARTQYDQYLKELDEVVAGRRGFVPSLAQRANEMGLQVGSLTMAAKSKGLKVEAHGRYGFCARK